MVPFAPEASRALVFAVVRAGCVGEGLSVCLFHFLFLFWSGCIVVLRLCLDYVCRVFLDLFLWHIICFSVVCRSLALRNPTEVVESWLRRAG